MNLTVFKILTENNFTPEKDYFFTQAKEQKKVTCIKPTEGGWYFSSEVSFESLHEMNAKLSSDNGSLKTNTLTMKELTFVESRNI